MSLDQFYKTSKELRDLYGKIGCFSVRETDFQVRYLFFFYNATDKDTK